jgi:hypothetical protein
VVRTGAAGAARRLTAGVVAMLGAGVGAATFGLNGLPAGAATRPSTPPGFRVVAVGDAGFGLTIPSAWVDFDFTQAALPERYRAFQRRNPNVAAFSSSLSGFRSDVQLVAADPSGSNEVSVTLAAGATALPSPTALRALYARDPENVRPVFTFVRVDGRRAMRFVHPCAVTPVQAGVSCAGSVSVAVVGRHGLLSFTFAPVPFHPSGADTVGTTQRMISSISLR